LQYDIVITTYQVVASDFPAIEKGRKKKSAANDMDNDTQSEASFQNTKKRRNDLDDFDDDPTSAVSSPGNSPLEASILPAEYDSGLQSISGYGPLFQTKWYRIVLGMSSCLSSYALFIARIFHLTNFLSKKDEAQQIKNRNTRSSLSCTSLVASKRWCLTGTPLQNNVDELYSLLRFLQIQPLANYSNFKKTISAQIQAGHSKTAMARLKAVLMAIMLRRTKSVLKEEQMNSKEEAVTPSASQSRATTPGATGSEAMSPAASVESGQSNGKDSDGPLSTKLTLKLPDREKKDVFLDFSPKERELYEMLTMKTKSTVEKIFKSGKDEKNYLNMLCMLLRLRQGKLPPPIEMMNTLDTSSTIEFQTNLLHLLHSL
jgi:SNF2-related domain